VLTELESKLQEVILIS